MIAIIALLLPGVSGSFILVILGKYNLIIASLKNPLLWDNAVVLLFFYAGMIAGLLCFVHGIYWVMKKWEKFVLAFLGGLTMYKKNWFISSLKNFKICLWSFFLSATINKNLFL